MRRQAASSHRQRRIIRQGGAWRGHLAGSGRLLARFDAREGRGVTSLSDPAPGRGDVAHGRAGEARCEEWFYVMGKGGGGGSSSSLP